MPYFYRPRRRRWWRRRLWRRRARAFVRRRYYWRNRRYRVRRRKKLPKITLKQWQPNTIRRLTIRGQFPLFGGTTDRIGNDYTCYMDEIAPHEYPGGGLYSATVFTLQGLYDLHLKGRNWWTTSNCNLPLIRYLGCDIRLYYATNVDYVCVYVNCGELKITEKMFQSCQPTVLMLNKNKKVLQCKDYKKKKRPYKRWHIKPPALMLNKWYFQKEIANVPLFMLLTSAMSLDRYYMPATAVSETMGFKSLNTEFFTLHNWKNTGFIMYKPQPEWYLLATPNVTQNAMETPLKDLTLLANSTDHSLGLTFQQVAGTSNITGNWSNAIEGYLSKKTNWGNIFHETYLSQENENQVIMLKVPVTSTILTILQSCNPTKTPKEQSDKGFVPVTKPFTIDCRYNPQPDKGHNATFMASITTDTTPWHQPSDEHIITQGLPLWMLLWGWHDYLRKSEKPQRLDTDYTQIIVSDYISPKQFTYFLPLDWFFLHGRSPYTEEHHIKPYDQTAWHPKLSFQLLSISQILQSGPGTAKLPERISGEAHITYKFRFKVGGCPPDMDEVCDPKKQPQYPEPGNLLSSILLQNPEQPLHYYINSFDQRREMLTDRAAKRLKKDESFTETFVKPTGTNLFSLQIPSPETTSTENSSEEEENEEETQQLLHKHRRKHRKLQRGILKLLQLMDK
nr:MAG: ORF1 [TTV-like mini virus]